MYMMIPENDPTSYAEALESIDPLLLGARLEIARLREFDSVRAAIDALREASDQPDQIKPRAYYLHESGERRPRKMSRLRLYADTFKVPLSYLLFGEGAEVYEAEARDLAARKRIVLKIDALKGEKTVAESSRKIVPINQDIELIETNTIHNPIDRSRVILTASEIRKLSTGRGDLATMSGPMLSVPDFLNPSRHSFWYRVPAIDVSMAPTSREGHSFPPGGIGLFDQEAKILPGDYVLAYLDDWDEPVMRQYVASRAYSAGASFKLEALNPAYEPIEIPLKSKCRYIARLVFFGNQH